MKNKLISFTSEEKLILIELLKQRINEYKELLLTRQLEVVNSALNSVVENEIGIYSSKEYFKFIGCVNEYLDSIEVPDLPTAYSWITISDTQGHIMRTIDCCNDILMKCGFFKKTDSDYEFSTEFRYRNVFSTIEKLKNPNKVFLYKVDNNDFYKVAFVYNNLEYVGFELRDNISLMNVEFIPLANKSSKEVLRRSNSLITTKDNAREILIKSDGKYPKDTIEFVSQLLY